MGHSRLLFILFLVPWVALLEGCAKNTPDSSPSESETAWTPKILFPLEKLGHSGHFVGEKEISVSPEDVTRLRGALNLLEEIMRPDDARRPLLRTTRIALMEDQGRDDVGARWVPETKSVEVGAVAFRAPLRLVLGIGHEFTHAVDLKVRADNLRDILVSEARAYHGEQKLAKRLEAFIEHMDGLEAKNRSYFILLAKYYRQEAAAFHSMEEVRLNVGDFAAHIGLLHDACVQAGQGSRLTGYLKSCELSLTAFARADRILNLGDIRSADQTLASLASFFTNSPGIQTDQPANIDALIRVLRQALGDTLTEFRKFQGLQERLYAYP